VHRLVSTLKTYEFFDLSTSRYDLGRRVAKLREQHEQWSPLLTFGVPAVELESEKRPAT